MNSKINQPIVLFAVLHWGLGHITRSLPIILELQKRGYKVIVCSDGLVLDFLQRDFPALEIETLAAYNIRYEAKSMAKNILSQLPKIYRAYLKEKKQFRQLVKQYQPKFIISDNRYGCRSNLVPSYFLGHQWTILNQKGNPHVLASRVNQFFIHKFDKMIIPDNDQHEFSGSLSLKVPADFSLCAGILSRYYATSSIQHTKKYEAAVILSGPEPARTVLEKKILEQLGEIGNKNFLVVRGSNTLFNGTSFKNIRIENLVSEHRLQQFILDSEIIIGRSGYSSLMDYIRLGVNKMILIPTKGQTEQEYLATYFQKEFGTSHLSESDIGQLAKEMKLVEHISIPEGPSLGINGLIDQIESLHQT